METPEVVVTNRGGKAVNEVIRPGKADDTPAGGMGLAAAAKREPIKFQTKAETPKDIEQTPVSAEPPEDPKSEDPKLEEPKTEEPKTPAQEPGKEPVEKPTAQVEKPKYKTLDEILATPQEKPTEAAKEAQKEPEKPKYKDDYIQKVVEYYERTGNLKPVLEALSTDWTKVSDEEMLMMDLREKHPNLSSRALQSIYKKEVIARYHLDADEDDDIDPEDIEVGKELFHDAARTLREAKIKQQTEFKVPDAPAPQNPQPDPDQIEAQRTAWKQRLREEVNTATLLNDKRVAVPYDGGEFNFEVDNPEELLDMTADESKVFAPFFKDGKLDLAKFYRAMAYITNEEKFIQSMKTHFKSLGTGEVMATIKNTKTPDPDKGSAVEPEGNITSKEKFLKEFRKKMRVS